MCSVTVPLVCVSSSTHIRWEAEQLNFPAETLPLGLRYGKAFTSLLSLLYPASVEMVFEGDTSSDMCCCWGHFTPSGVPWGFTMLNVLSSHRCTPCVSIYCYICPTDRVPSCNTKPIWKCFQLHTVPIYLLNIFNRMAKTNGRTHKLLKINKWSTRQFSALHHLLNPGYTTKLTAFLPDIWGISPCSFIPVYSGIFNRLSVLGKGQCNFTLLLLHIHRG